MIVQTDKGTLEGVVEDGINIFKGIPYAAPPVGALRWREPQPAAAWEGTRKADTFGKACIQPTYPSMEGAGDVGPQSEDCLFLNVWTAGVDPGALKPVMVWIHGGAFKMGVGSDPMYGGAPLAQKGAVVVGLNYRLGLLGFFAHAALEQEAPEGAVNFGLLDQIAALQWVQRNIGAFGGDPGNVTIFGQSAGAQSVLALLASPLARGLFHRGIAQSPYALPDHSRAKAVALGAAVATGLFRLDGERATAEQLRAVPAEKFTEKTMPGPEGTDVLVPSLGPVTVWGDKVLPKKLRATFEAGEQAPVRLIIGSNSDESSVLAAFQIDPAVVMQMIIDAGGEEAENALEDLKDLYRSDPEVKPGELDDPSRFASLVMRDMVFTMQARWFADRQSKLAESRRYYFSYVPEMDRPAQPHGVPHGGEIVFPFETGGLGRTKEVKFTDADRAMSRKVSDYWFSFARTGTPAGTPAWPKHVHHALFPTDKTMKLGETIEVATLFRKTRLDVFISLYPTLEAALGG